MSEGAYAQFEVDFMLNDHRWDDCKNAAFRIYVNLWIYARSKLRDYIVLDKTSTNLSRICRVDARTVSQALTKLQQKGWIWWDGKNELYICGVRRKHPKLRWKDLTNAQKKKVSAALEIEIEIEKSRVEKKKSHISNFEKGKRKFSRKQKPPQKVN